VADVNGNGVGDVGDVMATVVTPGCLSYLPLVVANWHQSWPTATQTVTHTPTPTVTATQTGAPQVAGCDLFPADNIWNTPVDTLPVDANSAAYINTIGANSYVHADFGSGEWPPGSGSPIGIPFTDVPGAQPKVSVSFTYADESDPGPYPIPPDAPIEGGPSSDGDRHVLIVDRDNCVLYELFYAWPQGDGSWTAGSGAIFNLNSHALRPSRVDLRRRCRSADSVRPGCATTRWPAARSVTRSASLPRRPAGRTSGRRGTSPPA